MKTSAIKSRLFLFVIPFLFTGCYTQFQTYDQFPLEGDRYSEYYSWDGFEKGRETQNQQNHNQPSQQNNGSINNGEEEYIDDELQMEMNDIYYIDYETKRWYEEHYANKLFWEGYREGYADGFYDGYNGYYPISARYSINRHRYLFGYTGAFDYYGFYHYPYYASSFWFYLGLAPYNSFYMGYSGYYGYNPYYYDSYWGHPYYSFYNYGYAYNYYYRTIKYSRNTDLYRKGPRNSGLTNYTGSRTRSDVNSVNRRNNSSVRTRGTTDLTRSRSNTNSTRVRGTTSTTNITRNTSRTGNSVTRTRGTSSTITRKGSGSSSSTRSRGSDSYLNRATNIKTSTIGSDGRTFTIPSRRVTTINNRSRSNSGRVSVGDYFKNIQRSNSNRNYRSSSSRNSGYTNPRSSNVSGSNSRSSRSRPTSVSRSSSSSSSKSSSRSSGSSSSSKRSRGGN